MSRTVASRNVFLETVRAFRETSVSSRVPSRAWCCHWKNCGSPASARSILSLAAETEGRPSGWRGGENSAGLCPTISSRRHFQSRHACSLQSVNRSVIRKMPSADPSKRVRYLLSLSRRAACVSFSFS